MPRRTAVMFTLLCAFVLSCVSVVLVYSASQSQYGAALAVRQAIWVLIGMGVAGVVAQVPREQLFRLSGLAYGLGLTVLILTLWIGIRVRGDRSWIDFGWFHVQPSEVMKVAVLLVFARVSQKISRRTWNPLLGQVLLLVLLGVPTLVIVLQSDLGTALVYASFLICWCFALGYWNKALVLIGVGSGLVGGLFVSVLHRAAVPIGVPGVVPPFGWTVGLLAGGIVLLGSGLSVLARDGRLRMAGGVAILIVLGYGVGAALGPSMPLYQRQRLVAFFDPYQSPWSSGYNIIQAQIALGSGGWFGKGYLEGSQSQLGFIPELWTDFIFSIAVEELGLLFAIGLCAGLFMLVYGVFSAAELAPDWAGYYLCTGVGVLWILHTSFNLGVCVGLLPVIGLPLPFLSYGGSFMVTNWGLLGLLIVASRRPKGIAFLSGSA